jgi:hypothetical protein
VSSLTSRVSTGKRLEAALETIRDTGWQGGYIRPHRAFVRLRLHPRRIIESVALAGLGVLGWLAVLPQVAHLWARIFAFWGTELGLNSEVTLVPQVWGAHIRFALPTFGLAAGPATGEGWWITTAVTVVAFGGSFLIGEEALPWRYLVRCFCLLQATALGYFALASARFPHDLPTYTVSMLFFSSILIGLIPLLYAFTFYVLNFTLRQKIFLTVVTMLHLIVFVPHQYLLHVYVLHSSVLFMPLLYFVFGPFLDILAFIGFYSWGMSWDAPEEFEI